MICLSFLMTKSVSIQTLVRQSQEMAIPLSSLSSVKCLKCRDSEVMQLNYKNKERSINIFGYRLKSENLFTYILHKCF